MSRLSEQAGKRRLAIVAGLTAVIAASWFLLKPPGVDLIGEDTVSATVIEVIQRKTNTTLTQGSADRIGIAVVELPDGGRARVFAPLSKVSVGREITVKLKRYSDGSRHVVGADEENTATTP